MLRTPQRCQRVLAPPRALFGLGAVLFACGGATVPVATPAAAPVSISGDKHYVLKHDSEVSVEEPAPHHGTGRTTAYRYFDELKDAGVIFRKRALHPGARNGSNQLTHDEVYYFLSGQGELEVDGERLVVGPGTAVFMARGVTNSLRQTGNEDLVLIIAYPPAVPTASGAASAPPSVAPRKSSTLRAY